MVCPKLPPRVSIDARGLEMRKSGHAMTDLSDPVSLSLCMCKCAACRRRLDDWCLLQWRETPRNGRHAPLFEAS